METIEGVLGVHGLTAMPVESAGCWAHEAGWLEACMNAKVHEHTTKRVNESCP